MAHSASKGLHAVPIGLFVTAKAWLFDLDGDDARHCESTSFFPRRSWDVPSATWPWALASIKGCLSDCIPLWIPVHVLGGTMHNVCRGVCPPLQQLELMAAVLIRAVEVCDTNLLMKVL